MTLAFTVPAVPVAQPRVHQLRVGNKRFGNRAVPSDHAVHAFKATCRLAAEHAEGITSWHLGICQQKDMSVRLVFVLPRPKQMFWKTKPMPRVPHVKRPDIDNCIKSLKDALSGTVWVDDSQVFNIHATKWIAAGDEAPHVEVRVEAVDV